MRVSKARSIKIFNDMIGKAEEIIKNPDRFKSMLKDAREVMEGKGSGPLQDIANRLKLLWMMLNDYRKGEYRRLPIRTVLSIVGVFLYLISPLDAIPDFIPWFGMIDDVFIVNFVWKQLTQDLEDYRNWRLLKSDQPLSAPGYEVPQSYINVEFETLDETDHSDLGN